MEASSEYPQVRQGEGYAVGHLDDLGDGPGFRKVRKGLGVTAFGVNAIVLPAGLETGFHYHDAQEELYFVHRGAIEMEFGDGAVEPLHPLRHLGEQLGIARHRHHGVHARDRLEADHALADTAVAALEDALELADHRLR